MKPFHSACHQRGAATLITAMALMMATSSMVLAAVHAQLLNSRANANARASVLDYLLADAGVDYAIHHLQGQFQNLQWTRSANGTEITRASLPAAWLNRLDVEDRQLRLTLSRSQQRPSIIDLSARVFDRSSQKLRLEIHLWVRPLSLLSPAGEQAPPLVLDGCIQAIAGQPDLYPERPGVTSRAPAIWSSQKAGCHHLTGLDRHQGRVIGQRFRPGTLWQSLFSVSPEAFRQLAAEDAGKSPPRRRYWLASAAALKNGLWTRSIGTPRQPVVLVFPASLGCPSIAAGVAIYGLVFYETACTSGNNPIQGEIYGTLAINGSLGVYSQALTLAHISRASSPQPFLSYPILQVPRLPGTWRDF